MVSLHAKMKFWFADFCTVNAGPQAHSGCTSVQLSQFKEIIHFFDTHTHKQHIFFISSSFLVF